LEATTGKRVWQRFTVPAPDEEGHETWPANSDTWKVGGGGVWTNVAVDRELGLAYVTTGNAVPPFAGDIRPGDNLYTDSLLAIDIETGQLKWHFQLVRHDVFDADAGTPVILYEARVPGGRRKAIAVLRADGYLFQFDRQTGEALLPIEDRPVPQLASQRSAATQPYPAGGESILMSCADWTRVGVPKGFSLGCMWTPPSYPPPSDDPQNVLAPFPSVRVGSMAYSPDTGFFYAHGTSLLTWPRRSQDPYHLTLDTTVLNLPTYGELAAIDSRTGRLAWRRKIAASRGGTAFQRGSVLVTRGGLVFRSSIDGNVEAYDASTGDLLWRFQTESRYLEGSPMSYAIGREQYVALSIGSSVLALKLGGRPSSAPRIPLDIDKDQFIGPIVDATEIETTTFGQSRFGAGRRYFVDEFTFNPYRARVRRGATVLFVNNGNLHHEIVAVDGSWGTGPLAPAGEAWVTFEIPGNHIYVCKEHPWSYGQILVEEDTRLSRRSDGIATTSSPQSMHGMGDPPTRGKEEFSRNCSACHGEDLRGHPPAPPLSGPPFISRWANVPTAGLVERIRTTMPPTNPGSLPQATSEDIAAYLLHANGLGSPDPENDDSPSRKEGNDLPPRSRRHR
jgi:outer membrane protein assembly factor BamB